MEEIWTTILALYLAFLLFGSPQRINAQLITFESERFEFSRSQNSRSIIWSSLFKQDEDSVKLQDSKNNEYFPAEYWLQSEPFPIGSAWRPPSSAAMFVRFDGEIPKEFWRNTRVYIRYSVDKVHWSTWSISNKIDVGDKGYNSLRDLYENHIKEDSPIYDVRISMPKVAQTEYQELYRMWVKSKDYVDSEHQFCVWLAKNHPAYFEREIPFIGYVQFRVEGNSYGFDSQVKLRSISFNYNYSISGLGYFDPIDKDDSSTGKKVESKSDSSDSEGAWHFDLSKNKVNSKD